MFLNFDDSSLKVTTMLRVTERLDHPERPSATLTLPFELRQKSRLRATLDSGEEVGLMLSRGVPLRGGDCLRAEDGRVIQVASAPEHVTTAFTKDPMLLARACYHLGNRHVPLQIGDTWVRYLRDHVLDQMVEALGLRAFEEMAPFEPEGGAYDAAPHGHGAAHGHDHGHGHVHDHDHGHDHGHEHEHGHGHQHLFRRIG
jgi:urease accessory protein